MLEWLPAGSSHRLAVITLLGWGAAELALRLRLAVRPGWRARLRTWSASAGGRLREWTFFLIVLAIAAAVIGALSLVRLSQFTIGGGRLTLVIGEAVAGAGIALRVWAILTLDRFFTFVVGISADHRVVQRGPYRLLRHPGYAGALLTLLGVGVAVRNWLSLLLIVAVPALALAIRITVEEAALAGALGAEYRAYADRTARLIPGIW
jgi:protein-S-isoprenylcysteine O-methyltransferase Ste14